MRLHGAFGHVHDVGNVLNRLTFHELKRDAGALRTREHGEGILQIELHACVSILVGLSCGGQVADVFSIFLATHIIVKDMVGNAIEPRLEARSASKLLQSRVGLDESFLRQVVAELRIALRQVEEETTQRRLIFLNNLAKGALVVKNSHLRDEGDVAFGYQIYSVWSLFSFSAGGTWSAGADSFFSEVRAIKI